MKKGIHPKYYPEAKVICACGNTWTTGSTKEVIHTEMCSVCHPFFTGEQRIVDTAGQVERFERRREQAEKMAQYRVGRTKTRERKKEKAIFELVTEEQAPVPEGAPAEGQPEAEQASAAAAGPKPSEKPRRAPSARPRREAKDRPARERPDRAKAPRAPKREPEAKPDQSAEPGA